MKTARPKEAVKTVPAAAVTNTAAGNTAAVLPRYLALCAAILVMLALRRPDALLNPQFWAEDGSVYFSDALVKGPASIFVPYAGCLWILPRIVALGVSLLPAVWAPFVFNAIALTVDAACCALLSLPAYRHLIASDRIRTGCCLLFAAAICAGDELIATLTNIPWYLALAAAGVVALSGKSLAGISGRRVAWIAGGAALCALSSPVVMITAPLALWQGYGTLKRRNWKMLAVTGVLLAGILIQGLVVLSHLGPMGQIALFPNLPLALLFPGILRVCLGEVPARFLAEHGMLAAAAGASLVGGAWTVLLARKLRLSVLLSALLLLFGPITMAIAGRHTVWSMGVGIPTWTGQRYLLLPMCSFLFLVAAWVDSFRAPRLALPALLVAFSLGIAGNFRVPPYSDFNWPAEAHLVREWLATGCAVSIPIPPGPTWAVRLPELASRSDQSCGGPGWLHAKAVDAARVGPVIPVSSWQADAAWTRGGFHPSVGTLKDENPYGSYSGSDANMGTLTSAPFATQRHGCVVLPVAHGPSIAGQSVRLIAADSGEDLGGIRLPEDGGFWQYWTVYFSREIPALRIVTEDRGNQFGQWVAVGEPHECR